MCEARTWNEEYGPPVSMSPQVPHTTSHTTHIHMVLNYYRSDNFFGIIMVMMKHLDVCGQWHRPAL